MTSLFIPRTGFSLYLCAKSWFQPASLAKTRPFYVPGPPSGRVVAGAPKVIPKSMIFELRGDPGVRGQEGGRQGGERGKGKKNYILQLPINRSMAALLVPEERCKGALKA